MNDSPQPWKRVRCEQCLSESGDLMEPDSNNTTGRAIEFFYRTDRGETHIRCEACVGEVEIDGERSGDR